MAGLRNLLSSSWGCLPLLQQLAGLALFLLLQTPVYFCTWLHSLMCLPYVLLSGRTANDDDIVDLIENTGLLMLSKPVGDQPGVWRFEVPGRCRVRMQGQPMETLSITYTSSR
jgi:hypothetical protein